MPSRRTPMVEVIYYVAASLDGYIATPDGGVAWLAPFEAADEDYGFTQFYASVDALICGSRTYEQARGFGEWPFPGKPCWVLSKRKLMVDRPEVMLTTQNPTEIVAALTAHGHQRVWLIGGGALAAAFQARGLITEYIVSIVPMILGAGIALFAAPGRKENLDCVDAKSYASGLVQLHYRHGSRYPS